MPSKTKPKAEDLGEGFIEAHGGAQGALDDPFVDTDNSFDGQIGDEETRFEQQDDFEFVASGEITPGTGPFVFVDRRVQGPGPSGYVYSRIAWESLAPESAGKRIYDNLSHSPDARFRWDMLTQALNWPVGTSFKPSRDLVEGKTTVWISVNAETFEGVTRPKVEAYASGPKIDPPERKKEPEPVQASLGAEFA